MLKTVLKRQSNNTSLIAMMVLFWLVLTPQILWAAPFHGGKSQLVKIGVLANEGGDEALKTWLPLAGYLNTKLPSYHFHILPLDLAEIHDAVNNHSIDFLLTNPGNFIELEHNKKLRALLTVRKKYQGQELNAFGAVIFTHISNTTIHSIADLKAKVFMGVKPAGFGGFQLSWSEFKKNNFDPFTDLSELFFSGFPHSAVVLAVRDKLVEVGTVRTGVLEYMADKGLIDLNEFRVIQEKTIADFPFKLSTDLYPEWPISYLSDTDSSLVDAVYQSLLVMPDNIIKSGKTHIVGWSEPDKYDQVHDLMRQLMVGPYKNDAEFSLLLSVKKYRGWFVAIFVLVIVMILFMLYTVFLNRRIMTAKQDLEGKIKEGEVLEQSLQREKNFLRALLENISEGVVAFDREGKITLYNQAALEIGGLEEGNIKGRYWYDVFDLYQKDGVTPLGADDNPFAKVLATHSIYNNEMLVKRQGLSRNILMSGQAIVDECGSKIGVVLSMHDVTNRFINERRLKKSERELRAILDDMQDTYYRTNLEGKIVRASLSVIKMFGYTAEEILGIDLANLYVEPDGRAKFLKRLDKRHGEIQNHQSPMWHKDGHVIWVSSSAHYHYDERGNIDGVEGVTRDITELKNAEAQLFQEKERAQITLQSIGDGVITIDINGNILYLNPYAEQMLGCSSDAAFKKPLDSLLYFTDATTKIKLDSPVLRCLNKEGVIISEHIHAVRKDGTHFAVKLTVSPMRDHEAVIRGVVMVMHDVSEMWKMAQQLSYQATHDSLTGLINRREFDQQLSHALQRCMKTSCQHTLCYMDLDQFKIVNDTCGHTAGDRLLKQLSQVLVSHVRENDIFARLGGDEFGLLLENCPLDKAEPIVEKIRKTVKEFRFAWEEKNFELGVSIGMVPVTSDSASVTELLSEADAACYVAKNLGRNRVHKYQYGDSELVKHKSEMQWVNRIQQALQDGRLISYCQFIKPLNSDDPSYAEILVRMMDEKGEIVLPGAFIPAAERFHLMSKIDRWVIRDVFYHLSGITQADMHYTINLSGQSVGDQKVLQHIIDSMEEYGINPKHICFEITETAAVANLDSARVFIDQLHELGCEFALDDFGSGLSSFAYLKNLNVDFLKIDGSFVRDIDQDPVDYAMVASINRIGHLMGIKTIAEFVEDKVILERLKEIGVDYVQGFNVDVPKPLSEMGNEKIVG